MQIGSIGSDYPARPAKQDGASASTDAAAAASPAPSSPKDELYDRLVHSLTSLKKASDEAEEQAKARAKQKLDDAKQQLEFMRRWGFDPQVIAKQAAQLGVIVAGAAREFTEALAGSGSGAIPTAPTNAPPVAEMADPILDRSEQAAAAVTTGDESTEDEKPVSYAEQAYLDEMDETPRETPKLSLDDIKTAMEFSTVARQIKALLEEAARRLREQNSTATVPGTGSLDASVNALTGTISAMPTVSITI
ncbi:hypothetical protein [Neorhizobium galegae]|uniref:hypothetical protein n=1 Tax=Neorhizobium galegae TaxID=399 RepID=UPI00062169F7|nr:hypothetical protein [Neorhizobium galegae]KAB1124203.1 hypothetical protein F4V90_11330 [Neorhizobium galegae]MCQ1809691.1 hypothetical protein [Neorhizobium galegae]CDZ57380.1 Hypothetical protein NGAL_HAMBI2566_19340 [Neorhizobium galegae bv. orientalis]